MSRRTYVALGVLLAAVAVACGTPDPDLSGPLAPIESPAEPSRKPTGIGDGRYAVGEDIEAGTYKTVAPDDVVNCYWARLDDFDGGVRSIVDNGNLAPGAKGRVVVKASDAGVEFEGGCEWKRAGK